MATPPKKLKLLTSDRKTVQADAASARKFEAIRAAVDGGEGEIVIPVRAKALRRMLRWCKRHAAAEAKAEKRGGLTTAAEAERLEKWDAEFARGLGDVFALEVALAADHLGARQLTFLAMDRITESLAGEQVQEAYKDSNPPSSSSPPPPPQP